MGTAEETGVAGSGHSSFFGSYGLIALHLSFCLYDPDAAQATSCLKSRWGTVCPTRGL